MSDFAKLFESEKYGQILVIKSTDDTEKPEIKFSCEPEGFGVCSIGAKFANTDEGWANRDSQFDKITLERAEAGAGAIFGLVNGN